MSASPLARRLADYLVSPTARRPAPAQASRAVTYALDTLAVTLAGASAPSSRPIFDMLAPAARGGDATLFGVGRTVSAWDAALGNGTLAHALELDDDQRIAVLHPGAVVVPAAFAIAEAAKASGEAFLAGLLGGYEVACRLGEVFRGKPFYHGVHPTPLCGAFGAAAAASMILELDAEATARAFGIAGTQASGLTEWRADGSWIKRLHCGRAAHAGVISAYLARAGFTGPATILEGAGGFFNAFGYGEELDIAAVTRGLGEDHRALATAVKPYPCCRFAHGTIDLALEAREAGIAPEAIGSIAIRIYRTDVLSYRPVPLNPVDAQFNLPYVVATALASGRVGLADFEPSAIGRPTILDLCVRTEVIEDATFSAKYPDEYWTELALELRDGGRRVFTSSCPSGDPEAERYAADPGLLHREVRAKAEALLTECGFVVAASTLAAAVERLPAAGSLSEVAALLGAAPR